MANEGSAFFNEAYGGTPPWDIGEPQPEFVRLWEEGEIDGQVLDAGCGTGENALFLAAKGLIVEGFDISPRAIERAKQKGEARKLSASFRVADALHLESSDKKFDTVIDSGLFHVFSDEDRTLYVKSLARVIAPGGRYFMLCFSEFEPEGYGPRRVTQNEIRGAFQNDWSVNWIRRAKLKTLPEFFSGAARGWLVSITRNA